MEELVSCSDVENDQKAIKEQQQQQQMIAPVPLVIELKSRMKVASTPWTDGFAPFHPGHNREQHNNGNLKGAITFIQCFNINVPDTSLDN